MREELARFDGRNGARSYVAYKGRVYDVTESFLWKDGRHEALHRAGCDLTEAFGQAPHGEDVFKRFPVVGVIDETEER